MTESQYQNHAEKMAERRKYFMRLWKKAIFPVLPPMTDREQMARMQQEWNQYRGKENP